MLGTDSGRLLKNRVSNIGFDLLDFLPGFLFSEAVEKEVDVGGRRNDSVT
jgi:hypothetical protein